MFILIFCLPFQVPIENVHGGVCIGISDLEAYIPVNWAMIYTWILRTFNNEQMFDAKETLFIFLVPHFSQGQKTFWLVSFLINQGQSSGEKWGTTRTLQNRTWQTSLLSTTMKSPTLAISHSLFNLTIYRAKIYFLASCSADHLIWEVFRNSLALFTSGPFLLSWFYLTAKDSLL